MKPRDEVYLNTQDAYYWLFYCVSDRIIELEALLENPKIPIGALREIGRITEELKQGQSHSEEIAIADKPSPPAREARRPSVGP